MKYNTWKEFMNSFADNSGHQGKVPYLIAYAYHIDTEFNNEGITRFQGTIEVGPILREMVLQSRSMKISYDTVVISEEVRPYVVYTIWFNKPYKPS